MPILIIILYVVVNLIIVRRYFQKYMGVFQAPFLLACISLTVILPQLTTIYFLQQYSHDLFPILGYTMISSNIFFVIGFEKSAQSNFSSKVRDFDLKNAQYLILFLALAGSLSILIYMSPSLSLDFVIASNIKFLAKVALSLSLVSILQGIRTRIVIFSLVLSAVTIFNFAFFVKGSRGDSFVLISNLLLFFALYIPSKRKLITNVFVGLVLAGSIISASISQFRSSLVGIESQTSLDEISYFETFQASFAGNYSAAGIDLGNAALGIDYCYKNNSYDYGLQVWNQFVFDFIPKRYVGEETKNKLYFPVAYRDVIPSLTHNITTMTGYFSAFSALSFFGFLFFFAIGYVYGIFWKYFNHFTFYKIVYFFSLPVVPLILTHGFHAFFEVIEIFFIFLFPLLAPYIKMRKVTYSNVLS